MNINNNLPTTDVNLPVDALIPLKQVQAECGFSKSSIYRMMASRDFPPPAKKIGRSVRWRQSAVQAWVRNEWKPAA
ncbi:AlpA family phage regulatory protein [Stenotrophomonas sp. SY1]|uniref:helix-turn-helix transcriptional regulator n=1 Tax=Stenotrophomonas sp. SY1 TaxID=477235 RepID=UPI001E516FBE|nr:AlpA family phage regulatory protein [Stenotrophomonas sp. SY1]MCD9086210.1 AlpA family phage regulatory protein [Stenotrophomonas sp. SY1]